MSHAEGHSHDHPWFLGHHWENPKQQFEAGKLGMWLFLATEVLLFGGLFCAYWITRVNHPELFRFGSEYLNTWMGAINTAVLILSSLTMAWGVTAAQQGRTGTLKVMLVLTLVGAVTFLVIKYFEYTHKFHEGWYPGIRMYGERVEPVTDEAGNPIVGEEGDVMTRVVHAVPEHAEGWQHGRPVHQTVPVDSPSLAGNQLAAATPDIPDDLAADRSTALAAAEAPAALNVAALEQAEDKLDEGEARRRTQDGAVRHPAQREDRPENAHMFFNIYFMMTGLHAVHVLFGMAVIIWLLVLTFKGKFGRDYFTPVDLGGLYWHVVDLIWIFLFPMFYLI